MKKIAIIVISLFILFGCDMLNTPTSTTEKFLTKYQSLNDDVLSDLELSAEAENIGSTNTKSYEDVMTRQYQNLKYEVTNEEINGDEAIVTTNITVYDLYKVKKEAIQYLRDNPEEFQENGTYKENLYIEYLLGKMITTTETVDYTIDFYLEKVDDEWKMKQLTTSTKEKIHGTYNYESNI